MTKTIAIIPARMGSSRFPGKPLVPILGLPMVMHVYYRARLCQSPSEVYVATPDDEIRRVVERYGAPIIMTSPLHERCTDRVAEAADAVETDADIVVNIQGDEPMLYPELVDRGVDVLAESSEVVCAHPIAPIVDTRTFEDRTVVKVATDVYGDLLFMSREPIPTLIRLGDAVRRQQFIVVLSFRRAFLRQYVDLPQTPLEQAESIDIRRILEHGHSIKTFQVDHPTISVDVESDVPRVEAALRHDPLVGRYLSTALQASAAR